MKLFFLRFLMLALSYQSLAAERACPDDWIAVLGDPGFRTDDFCIMKFEAKSDGGAGVAAMPVSKRDGTP